MNLLRGLRDSVQAVLLLRRIAVAQERQAHALEQLLLVVGKATGVNVGGFRTFYKDKTGDAEVEWFRVTDEEFEEMERERRGGK